MKPPLKWTPYLAIRAEATNTNKKAEPPQAQYLAFGSSAISVRWRE